MKHGKTKQSDAKSILKPCQKPQKPKHAILELYATISKPCDTILKPY